MASFLELAKAVCREAGISGGESAISSVTGNSGELARIVNYVIQAWKEIQLQPQSSGQCWGWMRVGFTLATVDGTGEYAYASATDDITGEAIARFRKWLIKDFNDPPKIYLTSAGVGTQGWLTYLDWNDFKALYRLGTQNDQYPAHISITPQNKLALGPVPNGIYTVQGDFIRGAQVLEANDDTPDMPEDFHDLIVWKALVKYGLFENAPEAVTRGEHEATILMGQLCADQLEEIPLAGPLDGGW